MPSWLLPEAIADVLPSEARLIENLRRQLLDCYQSYGYELVQPPLVEYLDALLTGSGQDLSLKTFKLVDQLSGRTLGVRPDITPQVARIDSHLLNRQGLSRLCYSGSVLHTRPASLFASREPLQVGAELYGHAGIEADLEIIELMLKSLLIAGASRLRLDVNHSAIVPSLLEGQSQVNQDEVYALLTQRDVPSLSFALKQASKSARDAILAIARSEPDESLAQLQGKMPTDPAIQSCFEPLKRLQDASLWADLPQVQLAFDLADLRGYRYHNGIVFSAFVLNDGRKKLPVGIESRALGRGGRYDGAGLSFGRSRPATGFSLELRELAALCGEVANGAKAKAIRAPWADDAALRAAISQLRQSGEIVVQVLPGHEDEQQEFSCDRSLIRQNGHWLVQPLN